MSVLIIGINVLVIVYPNFINVLSKNIKKNKILHLLLILLNLVILTCLVLIVVYYIKLNQLKIVNVQKIGKDMHYYIL